MPKLGTGNTLPLPLPEITATALLTVTATNIGIDFLRNTSLLPTGLSFIQSYIPSIAQLTGSSCSQLLYNSKSTFIGCSILSIYQIKAALDQESPMQKFTKAVNGIALGAIAVTAALTCYRCG